MHPSIAPLHSGGATLHGSAPLFQYDEGASAAWNHGEGFAAGGLLASIDSGGWYGHDDGGEVTAADVHTPWPWDTTWTFVDDTHPAGTNGGTAMRRLQGYLRPADLKLPTTHPLYGQLGPTQGPFGNGRYVDQGAFELFVPTAAPMAGSEVVICIQCRQTTQFPLDYEDERYEWRQLYRGFFSPDGLVRNEADIRSRPDFLANVGVGAEVERPKPIVVAVADPSQIFPIFGYAVTSVMHRQAELNQQRDLQLLQAIKLMLAEDPALGRNPLPAALTQQQVDDVPVVFVGGSNGGHQSMYAAMRHPDLVHGNLAEVINPSVQRMFGEHDMKHAVARLSGAGAQVTTIDESDFLHWGQYCWNQGRWIHDLSLLARHVRGQLHRPTCFLVGDEDVTSTGTDWVRVASGGAWVGWGTVQGNSPYGSPAANRFAWGIGDAGCHGFFPVCSPYTVTTHFHGHDIAPGLIADAIAQRLAAGTAPLPPSPLAVPRTPAQELRHPDDPHEWALGRKGVAMSAGGALSWDQVWFDQTQPGAAGTMLGYKESMLIKDHALYVGSAEGVVSKFVVNTQSPLGELVRMAQSHDPVAAPGAPLSLGHEAFAMTALTVGSSWRLVVATRRHLYLLDRTTLAVVASTEIPWELGQPRHLKVGDVLPNGFHQGPEIVFCSVHGGLAFYAPDLTPLWEWPEPGICDFLIHGEGVSILSHRGVVANVTFELDAQNQPTARLLAASKPIPTDFETEHTQGVPVDLQLMRRDGGQAGMALDLVAAWNGDADGGAVRGYGGDLARAGFTAKHLGAIRDIATTNMPAGSATLPDDPGDHLLVLAGGVLSLHDQDGAEVNRKVLTGSQSGYWPFGQHAHALVVGELVENTDDYTDEVVIATHSGALMWMHVQEVADTFGSPGQLPSPAFDVVVGSAVQPRTNRQLSATWAVARRSVDQDLHVLDQRGAYWRVTHGGAVALVDVNGFATDAHGWSDLDNRDAMGNHQPLSKGPSFVSATPPSLTVFPNLLGLNVVFTTPWAPIDSGVVYLEESPAWRGNNWVRDSVPAAMFAGFVVHPWCGTILERPLSGPGACEVWYWSGRGEAPNTVNDWGNVVEAYRVDRANDHVTGIWASTGVYTTSTDKCPHHRLRSFTTGVAAMNQQAVRVVELSSDPDDVVVVLGCPGGRVRVLRPGAMRVNEGAYHDIGNLESQQDLGFGGSALAVRDEGAGVLTIWFGTLVEPCAQPADYSATGVLDDAAVATGAVHKTTWTAGGGLQPFVTKKVLSPNTPGLPRGGYGVVGLEVADLLGGPEDEVIVGTVGGQIIVLDEDLTTVLWRANVPGAAGFYNSIRVEDLDGDQQKELYVSGSFGIWRFVP